MKKLLLQAFAVAPCLNNGVFMASCDDDDNPADNSLVDGETAYMVAATTDEASYLVIANPLDEETISTQGNGTKVIGGIYWVYKKLGYVFALVYNKGDADTGASYYLGADGETKGKCVYTYNHITSYGTWRDKAVAVPTEDSKITDEGRNVAQALLFNYLDVTNGSQGEDISFAKNCLGNGEKVSWAGLVETDNKIYISVILMGVSKYGIKKWSEIAIGQKLVTKTDGGSGSGTYTANVISSTQYPDNVYVAIYSGMSSNEIPTITKTDKVGYTCGRMRSQYYQTIWAADDDDAYVFFPGYGRTAVSSSDLKKATGQRPSGAIRIKAGVIDSDPNYYVNFEEISTKHPVFRCRHVSEDYFLLQLYKKGAEGMIGGGRNVDVSELAIFKVEGKMIMPVTGLPVNCKPGGEPYGEKGYAYIVVTVTTGENPAFYKIDAKTGKTVRGLTVQTNIITTMGEVRYLSK